MANEAEELRRIRRRVEGMNPPSVGCGVFVGLWLFLGSLLLLRGCFGVDVLDPLRRPVPASESRPATSAGPQGSAAEEARPTPAPAG